MPRRYGAEDAQNFRPASIQSRSCTARASTTPPDHRRCLKYAFFPVSTLSGENVLKSSSNAALSSGVDRASSWASAAAVQPWPGLSRGRGFENVSVGEVRTPRALGRRPSSAAGYRRPNVAIRTRNLTLQKPEGPILETSLVPCILCLRHGQKRPEANTYDVFHLATFSTFL